MLLASSNSTRRDRLLIWSANGIAEYMCYMREYWPVLYPLIRTKFSTGFFAGPLNPEPITLEAKRQRWRVPLRILQNSAFL